MSNIPANGPQANSQPTAPVLIRHAPLAAGSPGRNIRVLLPAFILSGVFHVIVMAVFLSISFSAGGEAIAMEQTVLETKVDDNQPPPNLEETDVGLDPDVPLNYNVQRIEDISVPGPVNPSENVGIPGSTDTTPANIPPPAGLGANGSGGGIDSDKLGHAPMIGTPGGWAGSKFAPGGLGGRSGSTREQMVREGGGNTLSEAAVARGLQWMTAHQAPDGHWSLDGFNHYAHGPDGSIRPCNCTGTGQNNDIAATAFGLLPLLGSGETHRSTGKLHKYAKNVERALKYLILKQNGQGDFGGGMYAHGLATIAVCEAYGLSSDPALKVPAQKAVNFIVAAQSDNGGWRYAPRQGGDTSVVGWQVMALKSAQMSGLDVPSKTLAGATKWLDSCASPDGGGYGYTGPADGASAMTAAGLLCREYLGWGPRNPGLIAGVAKLKQSPPTSDLGRTSMYYNYYATQVMHHVGGEAWDFWNPKMRDMLIQRQDKGDAQHLHQAGSWDPKTDSLGGAGGRIMITSMSLLTLEVYYRHLPLYRRDMGGGKVAGGG
jgi:hypothetical protein